MVGWMVLLSSRRINDSDFSLGVFRMEIVGGRILENKQGLGFSVKVRASYGTLGNGNISPYLFMETMPWAP